MRRRSKPVDRILAALADSPPAVRRTLIERLDRTLRVRGHARHPRRQIDRVFHELAARLRSDPDEAVRREIAHVFTFWFERRSSWLLRRVLLDPRETPRVRGQAAEGIGNVLDRARLAPSERERLSAALHAGLLEDELEIRFWCLYAVGVLRLTDLRPAVEHLRETDARLRPGWWRVSDEASDVLTFWDTSDWPHRELTPAAPVTG